MTMLSEICAATGLSASDATVLIGTAPRRYKVFEIPKRNGGARIIAQPSKELKLLQRFILDKYLAEMPLHYSATAYAKGRRIYANASVHSSNSVIVKLDFKDFFNSIRPTDFSKFLSRSHPKLFNRDEIITLANILFWGNGSVKPACLSVGAPTSPSISNILLFNFDVKCCSALQEIGLAYTRYADDITISGPSSGVVVKGERFVVQAVKQLKSPKLVLNAQKRGLYTKGMRRMVTGLVITPQGTISIGRERKRLVAALVHRYAMGTIAAADLARLKGLIGFAYDNEPDFLTRIRIKYGSGVLDSILYAKIPIRSEIASWQLSTRQEGEAEWPQYNKEEN